MNDPNTELDPFLDIPNSMVLDQNVLGQQNLMDFDLREDNPGTSRRTHTRAANNMHDYTQEEMNTKAEHQRGTPCLPIKPQNLNQTSPLFSLTPPLLLTPFPSSLPHSQTPLTNSQRKRSSS